MPRKPLHQRLRDLIPESVSKRIPESVKEKIRPPAWRAPAPAPAEPDPEPPPASRAPEWAMGPGEAATGERPAPGLLMWIPGTQAFIWAETPDGSTTVYEDSKNRPLPVPLILPYGTDGWIVRVGPDWVAFRVGENNPISEENPGAIFKVMKTDLFPTKPHLLRDWERRGRKRPRRVSGRSEGSGGRVTQVTARDLEPEAWGGGTRRRLRVWSGL